MAGPAESTGPLQITSDQDALIPDSAHRAAGLPGTGIRSGTGLANDPFIVENWKVTVPPGQNGLVIVDLGGYIEIRNVTFFLQGGDISYALGLRDDAHVAVQDIQVSGVGGNVLVAKRSRLVVSGSLDTRLPRGTLLNCMYILDGVLELTNAVVRLDCGRIGLTATNATFVAENSSVTGAIEGWGTMDVANLSLRGRPMLGETGGWPVLEWNGHLDATGLEIMGNFAPTCLVVAGPLPVHLQRIQISQCATAFSSTAAEVRASECTFRDGQVGFALRGAGRAAFRDCLIENLTKGMDILGARDGEGAASVLLENVTFRHTELVADVHGSSTLTAHASRADPLETRGHVSWNGQALANHEAAWPGWIALAALALARWQVGRSPKNLHR